MTIEQLQSEKRVLKEKIEKALNEFYDATYIAVSGKFEIREDKTHAIKHSDRLKYTNFPVVTINPIEI